jgi:hypothetical protein
VTHENLQILERVHQEVGLQDNPVVVLQDRVETSRRGHLDQTSLRVLVDLAQAGRHEHPDLTSCRHKGRGFPALHQTGVVVVVVMVVVVVVVFYVAVRYGVVTTASSTSWDNVVTPL